jgi:hypothetical protein
LTLGIDGSSIAALHYPLELVRVFDAIRI